MSRLISLPLLDSKQQFNSRSLLYDEEINDVSPRPKTLIHHDTLYKGRHIGDWVVSVLYRQHGNPPAYPPHSASCDI
jgi:hypothetical protein